MNTLSPMAASAIVRQDLNTPRRKKNPNISTVRKSNGSIKKRPSPATETSIPPINTTSNPGRTPIAAVTSKAPKSNRTNAPAQPERKKPAPCSKIPATSIRQKFLDMMFSSK